jgi:coenzyme PQQ synthesis protein D (PqqD)
MPEALLAAQRYIQSSSVVSRDVAGETLVVPIRGGVGDLDSIFSFNPLGSELWGLLGTGITVEEMVGWVVERYDVSTDQAAADIQAFLSELNRSGLIHSERS